MDSSNYFENLTRSVAVARILLQKAHENQSVIEGICLYVSIIDAFLRLSIIYTRTQKSPNYTYSVEKKMIYQDEGEKTYSEKDIYNTSLEEKIISPSLYERLQEMHLFRNKVVHRFNISDINYIQIAEACTEFESIYKEIFDIVAFLEHGSKGIPEMEPEEMKNFEKHMIKKIGK